LTAFCSWASVETLTTVPVGAGSGGAVPAEAAATGTDETRGRSAIGTAKIPKATTSKRTNIQEDRSQSTMLL
jgi:hypothetical protein